ncbi:MAG: beta,4-xylosidase with transcriptional regulator of AraC/XylS family, partial [Neobacillus sp.]|nr:beta,4-xylosidase with transcriptional regulator of AraC/XylS family [Neobacillus sp.]
GDIAVDCGFASTKAFNKAFKDFYRLTPSEYRGLKTLNGADFQESASYMEFDSHQAMSKLKEYMDTEAPSHAVINPIKIKQVSISVQDKASQIVHFWKKLTTIGRAYDCLRSDLQQQIAMAARELNFQYIRFHGIFSDEMRIIAVNSDRSISYCWQYMDTFLDFLQEVRIRPFFDLTFMPSALKSKDVSIFWYKGNISAPRDIKAWLDLVRNFVRHCINRYGIDEVRLWYFEIWNEPDFMWAGTKEEYFIFLQETIQALLEIDGELRVAGPSILQNSKFSSMTISEIVDFINEKKIKMPYFTYHIYGENDFYLNNKDGMIPLLGGLDFVKECIDSYSSEIKKLKYPVKEIHITEFNISAVRKNYLLDTMFPACYIINSALRNLGKLDSLGFWTLSDIFEENDQLSPPFGGGFGMITTEGIKKPSYYAYFFLNMLGDELLELTDDMVITRRGGSIQILAYNYLFYDKLFLSGDRSSLSFEHRYDVFEDKPPLNISFQLSGLSGKYRETRYTLDRDHGSAFDLYQKMGSPDNLTISDTKYLEYAARPTLQIFSHNIEDDFSGTMQIPQHGICMMILEKQY